MFIKEWYLEAHASDDLGNELNSEATFKDLLWELHLDGLVYDVLGVTDSLIRERVFGELAERVGKDYDYVYNLWLDSSTVKNI